MVVEQGGWRLDLSCVPLPLARWREYSGADACRPLQKAIEALFDGAIVNPSENQPARHMALRGGVAESKLPAVEADAVRASRARLLNVADVLYHGRGPVRTLLHAGIGGSDLGPRLVAEALDPADSAIEVEWLTTLDGRRMHRLLDRLDPSSTGLVIASKSFSTVETLTQARHVLEWLGPDATERVWATTANGERAVEFGVDPERVIDFPSWTGGRYSLWSGVGVSAAARMGPARWLALLDGARAADEKILANVAATPAHALARALDVLVRDVGAPTLGVVSYAPELRLLAEFLQQLIMESLGKHVDFDGAPVEAPASPLVFGGAGTDLQHSLFQALHQGTRRHPMLLVGATGATPGFEDWQREQLAHLLGQASALVNGRDAERPEQRLPGNNPVMTLLSGAIDPKRVGGLIATFEHAVYLLSVLWRINAFDQWGVEEGKRLAGRFGEALRSGGGAECPDPQLQATLDWIRATDDS